MKVIQSFQAEDGRKFDNKYDCEIYERVVLPVAGLLQTQLKARAIAFTTDTAPRVFAEILIENDSVIKQILAKAPGIKAQKTRQANRVNKITSRF